MLMFFVYFILAGIILVSFWTISHNICWKEAGVQLVLQTVLILVLSFFIKDAHLSDTELLNGRVTSKQSERVSCQHSYSCNCRNVCTGTGPSRTCSRVCDTCYEHPYDIAWRVYDNVGRRTTISRVDRRGLREPPRWTEVQIGDPVSHLNRYTNYIKADPDSLFRITNANLDLDSFPNYPQRIYDYYKVDRLVTDLELDRNMWNKKISEINADIGPAVQANLIVVIKNKPSISYATELQRAWEGGKKNDIILVIGSDGNKVRWSEIIGLAYPDFKVVLRNRVNDYRKIDIGLLDVVKETILENFKRRPMSDFEYLKESYKPTLYEWLFGAFISSLLAIGLGFVFHKNNFFK